MKFTFGLHPALVSGNIPDGCSFCHTACGNEVCTTLPLTQLPVMFHVVQYLSRC